MTLREALQVRAQEWAEDAARLRTTGAEKGCEKCLVAAEVYEECVSQVRDLLAHVKQG